MRMRANVAVSETTTLSPLVITCTCIFDSSHDFFFSVSVCIIFEMFLKQYLNVIKMCHRIMTIIMRGLCCRYAEPIGSTVITKEHESLVFLALFRVSSTEHDADPILVTILPCGQYLCFLLSAWSPSLFRFLSVSSFPKLLFFFNHFQCTK